MVDRSNISKTLSQIIDSCKTGDINTLNALLNAPGADPSYLATYNENEPITVASKAGKLAIVDRLLQIPEVNPAARENWALIHAAHGGYLDVVNRLLQCPQVDPGAQLQEPLRTACGAGHLAVVQRLLQCPQVDPTVNDQSPIRMAANAGHADIVRLLLQCPGVDPSADRSIALRMACRLGHTEAALVLLESGRVDISVRQYEAVKWSLERKLDKPLSFMLRDAGAMNWLVSDASLVKAAITTPSLIQTREVLSLRADIQFHVYFLDALDNSYINNGDKPRMVALWQHIRSSPALNLQALDQEFRARRARGEYRTSNTYPNIVNECKSMAARQRHQLLYVLIQGVAQSHYGFMAGIVAEYLLGDFAEECVREAVQFRRLLERLAIARRIKSKNKCVVM
eukprot:TRINITY_DN9671_c0_g3_i1.p1 TRINITY_DN9671_c0_g3~~TRINITY_DN9671_c0_g3_i1.p1  ORF type:complete len:398 (-),score=36.18 TRINITY_DN9671_c0_g3_i1:85-1278(-)